MNDQERCAVETVVDVNQFGNIEDNEDPASDDPPSMTSHGLQNGDGCDSDEASYADSGEHDKHEALANWMTRAVQRVLEVAHIHRGHLSLAVVDDAQMTDLHERFLDDPTTTDVLTFDLRDTDDDTDTEGMADDIHANADDASVPQPGEHPQSLFGEIIVCYDVAKRQAIARGHDIQMELLLYVVHGLLHLLGYDDHDPIEAARMHQREDEWLAEAGFPPVYRTDSQP